MAIVAADGRLRGGWLSLEICGRVLIHIVWRMGVRGVGRWLLGESPWLVVHAPHFLCSGKAGLAAILARKCWVKTVRVKDYLKTKVIKYLRCFTL